MLCNESTGEDISLVTETGNDVFKIQSRKISLIDSSYIRKPGHTVVLHSGNIAS